MSHIDFNLLTVCVVVRKVRAFVCVWVCRDMWRAAAVARRGAGEAAGGEKGQGGKGAKKAPGVNEILLPGERGDAFAAKVAAKGAIDVEPNLWSGLQELAATYSEDASASSPDRNGAYST